MQTLTHSALIARLAHQLGKDIRYGAPVRGSTKEVDKALKSAGLGRESLTEIQSEYNRQYFRRYDRRQHAATNPRSCCIPTDGKTADRLYDNKISAIRYAAKGCLRNPHEYDIRLTDDPQQVACTYSVVIDRDTYRGSYRGWGHNTVTLVIAVPTDWRVRVERTGLARAGGMLTLTALKVDEGLYAATWVEQRRGYSCQMMSGFIATSGRESCHGKTAGAAKSSLANKLRLTPEDRAAMAKRLEFSGLASKVAKAPSDAVVCVADALASGACEYGIRSWCNLAGIDYERGCESLTVVFEAFQSYPVVEARRAILYVLRRAGV